VSDRSHLSDEEYFEPELKQLADETLVGSSIPALTVKEGKLLREAREARELADSAESLSSLSSLSSQSRTSRMWKPPELERAALHGAAGEWALASQPFTEASAAGVLVSTLVAFGNAVGGTPRTDVGATPHHANEYALLIGPTGSGRKGDAMRVGLRPVELADPSWRGRIVRGFGSGEAIIDSVRDAVTERDEDGNERTLLAATDDKRLLIHESELASVLAIAARRGSTTASLLRQAWDRDRLDNRTKGRTITANDAHISFLAAVTPDELRKRVPEAEIANGFLNRFLLIAVTRSKYLPGGAKLPNNVAEEHASAFAKAITAARNAWSLRRDAPAEELWKHAYMHELAVERHGLAGNACARAEPHALRLSMLYALLDRSPAIQPAHVEAALALWRYAEQTAVLVFGDSLGDATADMILAALHAARPEPLSRTAIRDRFERHRSVTEIDAALARLVTAGHVAVFRQPTGGRPTTFVRLA
jgi:hypothetical protein